LKITYLYQYFGTPKGSWSTRVYELAKRWVEAGHSVTVITSPYDKSDIKANGLVSHQEIDGIKLIVINAGDSNRMSIFLRAIKAIQFSLISAYYAIKTPTNLIIASSGPITIGIPGLIGKFIKRVPLVFEVRDLWPDGGIEMGLIKSKLLIKISRWFEKICYKQSSLIIPCSIGMESSILNRFPLKNTLVIPNACDLQLFQEKSMNLVNYPNWLNVNTKLFLYTGSLGFMDSCIEIIDGFSLLKDNQNIHIVFLGDGSERNELEQRVKYLKLTENIHFIGLVQKHEVVAWYHKSIASFVVFKNYSVLSTSSPNKMFDSFAAGIPIIQNTEGWIKNLVTKENCGINVIPNDAKSMMLAIEKIAHNTDIQQIQAANALRLAQTEFNRDILAAKYLNALICLNN
jgi:glycosyltransferase involved in cell wall biosynthesis